MVFQDYPVGVTDFAELVSGGYLFVDKTPMISHICGNIGKRFMFARPHGFGKTLNLSMLDRFFNMRYAGEPDIFEGLLVESDPEAMELRNSLPVIILDLGGLGEDLERGLSEAVAEAFGPFGGLEGLHDDERRFIEKGLELKLNRADLRMSVEILCGILKHVHKKEPMVLVDDYDACFRDISTKERYREVSSVVGTFMEQTFKHNPDMRNGVVFAEMPSLRTGMFGGFDSYCLCGIENREGDRSFGFTREEVDCLVDEAGLPSADAEFLEERFGGYRIGDADMFDPSGVMRYMGEAPGRGRRDKASVGPSEYLVSTLGTIPPYTLRRLIDNPGTTVEAAMDHMVSHVEAVDPMADLSQVCSYLSMAGYLRAEYTGHQISGMPVYRFSIPNGEVRESLSTLVSEAGESAAGRYLVRQSVGSSPDPDRVGERPRTGNRSAFAGGGGAETDRTDADSDPDAIRAGIAIREGTVATRLL